jgi:hypothetical protein
VGTDGLARDVRIISRPLGHGLDEEEIKALNGWTFKPATSESRPVPTKVDIEMEFRNPALDDKMVRGGLRSYLFKGTAAGWCVCRCFRHAMHAAARQRRSLSNHHDYFRGLTWSVTQSACGRL